MTLLKVVCMAYLIIVSEGDQCKDNQHCSQCDRSGYCLTDCDTGYFDRKCRSVCSKTCRNHSCRLSTSGIGDCTDGCVAGYQGPGCNIPCASLHGSCRPCPGGCAGGYCQLGSSYVSGCVDSYYGTDCKSCSSRCKSCNRIIGSCRECHPGYFGPNCVYSCDHCLGSCEHGCTEGCLPGFYGVFCDKTCGDKCGPDPNVSTDKPQVAPNTGVRNCHRDSGNCIHGCDEGWYGRQCSSPCSPNCRNDKCQSDSGSCADGCARGFYGGRCHLTCKVCRDGVCDQKTGTCTNGCYLTGRRCDSTCTFNCSMEECKRLEYCNQGNNDSGIVDLKIGLSTAFSLFVVIVLLALSLFYCKHLRTKKDHQVQAPTYDVSAYPNYCEILDEDVDEPPGTKQMESVKGTESSLPVLADCFAPDSAVDEVAISEQYVVDDDENEYSKLHQRKVVVERPKTTESYVFPIAE
ncbi:scavenger receptor class F member 1-like [Haliotis asinina]|uniref:scavenger receptor class F member 1-like n=1 Tax=Haliotis asinina TaxID=109174 RepID=UPI003531CC96